MHAALPVRMKIGNWFSMERLKRCRCVKKVYRQNLFASRFLKLEIPSEYQKGLARIREFEVYGKPAVQPEIISNNADLKAAYELALWTVNINTTQMVF